MVVGQTTCQSVFHMTCSRAADPTKPEAPVRKRTLLMVVVLLLLGGECHRLLIQVHHLLGPHDRDVFDGVGLDHRPVTFEGGEVDGLPAEFHPLLGPLGGRVDVGPWLRLRVDYRSTLSHDLETDHDLTRGRLGDGRELNRHSGGGHRSSPLPPVPEPEAGPESWGARSPSWREPTGGCRSRSGAT